MGDSAWGTLAMVQSTVDLTCSGFQPPRQLYGYCGISLVLQLVSSEKGARLLGPTSLLGPSGHPASRRRTSPAQSVAVERSVGPMGLRSRGSGARERRQLLAPTSKARSP